MNRITLALCLLALVGCANNGSSKGGGTQGKVGGLSLPENTCQTLKADGTAHSVHILRFNDDGINAIYAEQTIYNEGQFPKDTHRHNVDSPVLRAKVLVSATASTWSVGGVRDESGKWTKLRLFKTVLSSLNNELYIIDSKTFEYGSEISAEDTENGMKIACSLPK